MNFLKKEQRGLKRRNDQIDRLANKERKAKLQGKVKKIASEGLKFGACCLLGLAVGAVAYFQI